MKYEYYLVWTYEWEYWSEHVDDFCAKYNEDSVLLRLRTLEEIYEDDRDMTYYTVVKVEASKVKHCISNIYYPFTKEDFNS